MKRFSVSLVYTKDTLTGISVALRVLFTSALSKEEALGKAIEKFKEDTKGYSLDMHIIIDVNSKQDDES